MLYLEFVNELCGNFIVYYLGVYSYMADVTNEWERTSRLSVLDGTDYISTMIGSKQSRTQANTIVIGFEEGLRLLILAAPLLLSHRHFPAADKN